jgi:hypothetical protein
MGKVVRKAEEADVILRAATEKSETFGETENLDWQGFISKIPCAKKLYTR